MEANTQAIGEGDVVQIDPAHSEMWGACLMVVTEVKAWGYQGYVRIPGHGKEGGIAFLRVKKELVVRIGRAEWTHQHAPAEEPPKETPKDGE